MLPRDTIFSPWGGPVPDAEQAADNQIVVRTAKVLDALTSDATKLKGPVGTDKAIHWWVANYVADLRGDTVDAARWLNNLNAVIILLEQSVSSSQDAAPTQSQDFYATP